MSATAEQTPPSSRLDDLDFAFYVTMDDTLTMARDLMEKARWAPDDRTLGAYLKMASRCVRCALELYADRLSKTEVKKCSTA
jgi:hypothetical protein